MVTVHERPVYPPYICVMCSAGSGKKWFVDLHVPLDNFFNPVNDGAVYYCNECWENLCTDTAKEVQRLMIGTEPWEYATEPTYSDESELLVGTRGIISPSFGFGEITPGHSESAERDHPDAESDDSAHSADVDSTEPVAEFREFFGDKS